jgi:hypothetical protein
MVSPGNRGGIPYAVGERSVPSIPNSKIFVFEDFYSAKSFARAHRRTVSKMRKRFAVLKVEAEDTMPISYCAETFWNKPELARWWKRPAAMNHSMKYSGNQCVPWGTLVASAVTVLSVEEVA